MFRPASAIALHRVLALGLFASATGAVAQDGGTPDIPLICGNTLDEQGQCYGETAAWCSQPNTAGQSPTATVETADCPPLGASCVEHADIGAWCAAPDGAACAIATEVGTAQLLCGGGAPSPGPGCDVVDGCRDDAPLCSPGDEVKCANDDLVLGCSPAAQPLFVRCSGRCVAEPVGCVDEIAGRPCREGLLSCAEGLLCLGDGASGYGTCVAPGDAVSPTADGGSWAPESPGAGCACSSTGPSSLGPRLVSILFFVRLIWARRRQR